MAGCISNEFKNGFVCGNNLLHFLFQMENV